MSVLRYEYIIDFLIKENKELKKENKELKYKMTSMIEHQNDDNDIVFSFLDDDTETVNNDDVETVALDDETQFLPDEKGELLDIDITEQFEEENENSVDKFKVWLLNHSNKNVIISRIHQDQLLSCHDGWYYRCKNTGRGWGILADNNLEYNDLASKVIGKTLLNLIRPINFTGNFIVYQFVVDKNGKTIYEDIDVSLCEFIDKFDDCIRLQSKSEF